MSQPPTLALSCVLLQTTNIALGAGADVPVTFTDADVYDADAMHAPGGANPERVIIPANAPGVYHVEGEVQFNAIALAAGDSEDAWIEVGAIGATAEVARSSVHQTAAGRLSNAHVSWTGFLAGGEEVEMHATSVTGDAAGIQTARLTVARIANAQT